MLYIIRHGKTDWNALRRLQGQTDIPLNEEGREMARKAATEYREIHFDECYSSPLIRARETAKLLLEGRNVPIYYDDRLKEMSFGIYEGVQNSSDIPESPMKLFFESPQDYEGVEGGETFEELFARTGSFLAEVVKPKLLEGKDILIVGHGAMNSSIVCQVKGYELKDFWKEGIPNCRLIVL